MPVVAVAAGAFAVGEIATVGIAAMSAFEVIGAVGAIVSGIGALTGNEDLMKIGAVAGLAGGIGAFAQGKGWLAAGGDAAKSAAAGAEGGNIQAMTQAAAPNVETTAGLGGASNTAQGTTAGLEAGAQAGADAAGSISQNLTSANPLAGAAPEAGSALIDAPSAVSGSAAVDAAKSAYVPFEEGFVGTKALTDAAKAASPSVLDTIKGFGKFLKENKELASMGFNFLGGMFDDEKKAKAEYYQTAADTAKAKLANGSAVPNMNFTPSSGSIWKPTSPVYNPVRPSSLFYAR